MLSKEKIKELQVLATKIRIETLKQFRRRGFGHVGGAMSIVEALAVLYGEVMNINIENPKWTDRDWLVLSKGHAGPALYSALALKGFFNTEELLTLNQPGTNLPSHCDMHKTIGVDMTTGSLGQGTSTAIGVAIGNMLDGRNNYTYVVWGDGEINEGQVWEGALYAAQKKLYNLIAFVDYNKQQLDGYTKDINDLGDVAQKFKEFGWYAQDIYGSDVEQIYDAIQNAKNQKNKPSVIVLNTIKGKDCYFAEGELVNHHITVSEEQANKAIDILEKKLMNQFMA